MSGLAKPGLTFSPSPTSAQSGGSVCVGNWTHQSTARPCATPRALLRGSGAYGGSEAAEATPCLELLPIFRLSLDVTSMQLPMERESSFLRSRVLRWDWH